jgi:hypothetical protein
MDALFLGRKPWLVGPDLANDPGPGVGPSDTFGRVADDLVGERLNAPAVDPGLGRPTPSRVRSTIVDPPADRKRASSSRMIGASRRSSQ